MNAFYAGAIREKARNLMQGRLGVAILVLLLFALLTQTADVIDSGLQCAYSIQQVVSPDESDETVEDAKDHNTGLSFNMILDNSSYTGLDVNNNQYQTPTWLVMFSIVQAILTIPISVGVCWFFINYVRKKDVEIGMMFSKYNQFFRILLAKIYVGVIILLFTLLLIIPGIIAAYKYALVEYIIAEDDSIGVSEAASLSAEMMKGHKWELFCLQFSFIGWFILSAFTGGILYIAYVGPYYQTALAVFYDEIKALNKAEVISENQMFGEF